MPGRPCRELMLLQQHDIGPAQVREMVGDAAAGDAAADDHHLSTGWHGRHMVDRHNVPLCSELGADQGQ
jgi:hypothetical protein